MVRFTNWFTTGIAAAMLTLGAGGVLSGCKSDEAAAPAKAEPAKGNTAPASSKLSKVKNDMSPEEVQHIMGSPTGQANYPTGKTFNPYNFGNDSGNRVEYKYKGQGRVVFAIPKWGGNMKVVRVDYDPAEKGN
ncbi:MAG TPA: hypothetical protein VKH41_10480 [Myxococcota bacterium]|nr:hypothetical protein [Myxococcota bacterium]